MAMVFTGALPTGRGNTQRTGKHRLAKRQLNKPGLQISTQWPERPRTHTAQTLWRSCNYIYVWSSLPIVGVLLDLGATSYSLRSFGPHLARQRSPPPPYQCHLSLPESQTQGCHSHNPAPTSDLGQQKEDNGGVLFKGASSC